MIQTFRFIKGIDDLETSNFFTYSHLYLCCVHTLQHLNNHVDVTNIQFIYYYYFFTMNTRKKRDQGMKNHDANKEAELEEVQFIPQGGG